MNPQLRDNLASAIREAAIDVARDHDDPGDEILVDLDRLLDVIDTVLGAHLAAARSVRIGELDLSVRVFNAFRREGIDTVGQLLGYTASDLLDIRNIGAGGLAEIRAALTQRGLHLAGERRAAS